MPILKSHHFYINKSKTSPFIKEILPMRDLDVSEVLFQSFEDTTWKRVLIDNRPVEHNRKGEIEKQFSREAE